MPLDIIHFLSIWIIIIPALVGFMNLKGLNNDSKWIFSLVLIALVPQVLSSVINEGSATFNISYNLYSPIEFAIVYVVFLAKFIGRTTRLLVQITAGIYAVCCAYLFIRFGIVQRFLNVLVCINNIIYMFWILLLFKQEYQADSSFIEKSNPFTWYLIALIIYAPCTVLVFALYPFIKGGLNGEANLWMIQGICNILMYLLFSAGLLIRKTRELF